MKWFSLLLLIANIGLAGWGYFGSKTQPAAVSLEEGAPTAARTLVLLSEAGVQVATETQPLTEVDDGSSVDEAPASPEESDTTPSPSNSAAEPEGAKITFQKMVDPQPAPTADQEFVPNARRTDALLRSASGIAKVFSAASDTRTGDDAIASEIAGAPTAADASSPAEQTAPANQYCVSVGPMYKRIDAERVQQLLEPVKLTTRKLRTEATASKNGYWVVIPAHAGADEAKQRVRDLEKAGISGIWRFTKGSLVNAISLGLFSQRSNAERYAAEIAGKGFPTEVVPRTEEKDSYWLDFMRDEKPVVPPDVWRRITGEFPDLELESKPCSSIVSR